MGGGSEGGDDGHGGAAGPLPEFAALRAACWRSQDNEHYGAEEQRESSERTLGVKRTVIHTSTMCPGPLCDPVDVVALCIAPRTRRPLWITQRRRARLVILWTDTQASSMSVKVSTLTPTTSLRVVRP